MTKRPRPYTPPPTMTLAYRLADARAEVDRLEREAISANCAQLGHAMQYKGGRNAGCAEWCACSVPVYECTRCGDCDYGENDEARRTVAQCKDNR